MKHIKTILFCNVLLYSLSLLAQNVPVQQPTQPEFTEPESLLCQAFYKTLETMLKHPENQALLNSLPTDIKEPLMPLIEDPSLGLLRLLNVQTGILAHCPVTKAKIINLLKQKAERIASIIYNIASRDKLNLDQMLLKELKDQEAGLALFAFSDAYKQVPRNVKEDFRHVVHHIHQIIQYMLKAGIDINQKVGKEQDPLLIYVIKFAQNGTNRLHPRIQATANTIVYELIKHNVDINARDNEGNTALMHAVINPASPQILEKLLRYQNIDTNQKNNNGENALLYMIRNSPLSEEAQLEIAKKLIAAGINIIDDDKNGINALDEAQQKNQTKLVQLFQEHLAGLILNPAMLEMFQTEPEKF